MEEKIQEILDYLDDELHPVVSPDNYYLYLNLHNMVSELLPDQTEQVPEWAHGTND